MDNDIIAKAAMRCILPMAQHRPSLADLTDKVQDFFQRLKHNT
jgi:hypothetical protein